MENNKENRNLDDNQEWLDELLNTPTPVPEIGPDEHAVHSAGLTRPEDMELEKILAEDWLREVEELPEEEADQPAVQEEADMPEEAVALEEAAVPEETKVPDEAEALEEEIPLEEANLPEQEETPQRKGRPKGKKGYGLWGIPHLLATAVWLALIVAIGLSLGRVLWVSCADIMAFGKEPISVKITITEQDDIDSISQKLGKANLVKYPGLFKLFADLTGKDENISVGTFTLSSELDYNAMINAMVYYGATREEVEIMFPEGANCAQIFRILEKENVCTVADLEAYAADGELKDYWFLEGVERGDKYCLEGYMSPDTYKFYTNDEPRRVIEKFLNEFDDRFTDIMKEDFANMQQVYQDKLIANGFDETYIAENPLTLHQVVTLASIIQKEMASNGEVYDIASVFYNRLTNPEYLYLGSDATVYYAIGDYFGDVDELTDAQLNVDSPYNTRNHQGVPPGPICNMGVYSLYGALDPNETDYYYFVYDPNNYEHRFSSTYEAHMQNVAELEG